MIKLVSTVALLAFATATHAADYAKKDGTLAFAGVYDGEPFEGRFEKFTANVSFDPANVAATTIAAEIDVTSANTENEERDMTLSGPEFFDYEKFPTAKFSASGCTGTAAQLACKGSLTIRDRTREIPFPASIVVNADGSARLTAKTTVKRTQFDVGTGEWADTGSIADDVVVTVDVGLAKQ